MPEVAAEDEQREQGADGGRPQAREDRQRMHEAFVENAEHEIDHGHRHQQQDGRVVQRDTSQVPGQPGTVVCNSLRARVRRSTAAVSSAAGTPSRLARRRGLAYAAPAT